MFASLNHGNTYVKIHDPAALWVKSVSTTGFQVCAREAGSGSGGTSVINWLAFQGSHQGIQSGIVDFDEWTTRTQCKRVSIGNQSNVSSDLSYLRRYSFATHAIGLEKEHSCDVISSCRSAHFPELKYIHRRVAKINFKPINYADHSFRLPVLAQ